MHKKYNWGIIGLGWIAAKFAEGLQSTENGQLCAVASRDKKKAEEFASQYNVPVAYGSYEELAEDKNIDIVYIATPHNLHCENTIMCLERNIPVLCEKPFAINSVEVKKMIAKAIEKNVFLMEAMWTAFLPSLKKVKETVQSGALGKIQFLRADFGIKPERNPEGRFFNPRLGGGSLLDVGIYPAYLALELLGKPNEVKALAYVGNTGVDENCGFIFSYSGGQIATLFSSIVARTGIDAMIAGENAKIVMHSHFFMPTSVSLITNDGEVTDLTPDFKGNGYNYEAEEVMHCLENGLGESHIMSHKKSIELIELLDEIRIKCGIRYPDHDEYEQN
jgi:predicted dehydrogenase